MAKARSNQGRTVATGAPPPAASGAVLALRLPDAVHARLRAEAGPIARRMSMRIAADIPLGADFRTTAYLRLLLRACRQGVDALIRHLRDGRRPHPAELAALGTAGARQAEMGVPLDVLLAAYRLAAKMVWREVVDEATTAGGLDPATVVALTDQVLDYLDDISAAVGTAYLQRREEVVRRRDRERDHLLRRLLAGDAGPELRRQAVAAGLEFSPPYRVLAIRAGAPDTVDRLLASAWRGLDLLVVAEEPGSWVVLAGLTADCRRLVDGALSAGSAESPLVIGVGPEAATLGEVGQAARRARRALLAGRRLDPTGRVFDDRDLGVLAALAEHPAEARSFVSRHLGPLLEPPGADVRHAELLDTLRAVVTSPGLRIAADRLGVHRHTVVYRLARLRELLGVDLDEPQTRHRIWLALVVRSLLQEGDAGGGSLRV